MAEIEARILGYSIVIVPTTPHGRIIAVAGIEARFLGYSIVILPTTPHGRLITVDLVLVEIDRDDVLRVQLAYYRINYCYKS